jgi:hypothetical protein
MACFRDHDTEGKVRVLRSQLETDKERAFQGVLQIQSRTWTGCCPLIGFYPDPGVIGKHTVSHWDAEVWVRLPRRGLAFCWCSGSIPP